MCDNEQRVSGGYHPRVRNLAHAGMLLAALLVWQLAALAGLPDFILSPWQIARNFVAALGEGEIYGHVWASLCRSLPGFAIGSFLGATLGLAAGVARWFDRLFTPAVFLTYPVPKIVMLPIFMIWFGIGDLSKVLIIALACFYPVFINAFYGVRQTRTILVWSALNMGASRSEVFRRVVLPSATPMIFASLRVSLALSFIVMFAAEMINARSGLGYLIRIAENSLRFDLMYVALVAIAILGYAGDRLVRFSQSRLVGWQQ
jgi:ABC-type nitrate/sulfonate/bicarbonate transport system permease component